MTTCNSRWIQTPPCPIRKAECQMEESRSSECAQFVFFKANPKFTIGEELFQEAWIPRAQGFRARGIELIILSKKADAKNDSSDYLYISKTWWNSKDAVQSAFADGLKLFGHSNSLRTPMTLKQVGCFQVNSVKVVDSDVDPNRYKKLVKDEIKLCVMSSERLSNKELISKAESLCLVTGFQSYCIYELDKECLAQSGGFYNWIIEAFFQTFFMDSVLQGVSDTGQFTNCDLTVHQDLIEFKV